MTARKTPAARARALRARHPAMPKAEIARKVDTTPQAVAAALSVTHARPGRPGVKSVTVRLSAELVGEARRATYSIDDGSSLREWIERAIRMRLKGEMT